MRLITITIVLAFIFSHIDSYAGLYQKYSKWEKQDFKICFLDEPEMLGMNEVIFSFDTKEIITRKASLFKKEIRERVNKTIAEEKIIPFPQKYKDSIREVINQSYEEVGFKFNGWVECSKDSNVDLMIVYSDVNDAYLATGAIGDPTKDKRLKNKKINSIRINSGYINTHNNRYKTIFTEFSKKHNLTLEIDSLSQSWALKQLLAGMVHEVGHFLGLEHEHMIKSGYDEMKKIDLSPDNKVFNGIIRDNRYLDFLDTMAKQNSYETLVQIGDYDPLSIMSYIWQGIHPSMAKVATYCQFYSHDRLCNSQALDFLSLSNKLDKSLLSPHDILVLKNLYFSNDNIDLQKDIYSEVIMWLEEYREHILNL